MSLGQNKWHTGKKLKSQVDMLLFVDTDGFQIDTGCIRSS